MNRLQHRSAQLARAFFARRSVQRLVAASYHGLFWHNADTTWKATRWLGTDVHKLPLDLWTYQEILVDTMPDVLVETGTRFGGSALFYASIMDLLGRGRVVSIDVMAMDQRPEHPRITYLTGSSVAPEIVAQVRHETAGAARVMVVLDSDHSALHVGRELEALSGFVTPGNYLVAEDGAVRWHPVRSADGSILAWDRGPSQAVAEFLDRHPEYVVDRSRERYYVTENPGAWLMRR